MGERFISYNAPCQFKISKKRAEHFKKKRAENLTTSYHT